MSPRVLVVLPTYDERGSISAVTDGLLALGVPGLEVLVVDDESPDGTAALVEELARTRPALRLLRRRPPAGRGLAGRDGFLEALRLGAESVVEMDADGSHRPADVPALLDALKDCDLAVGSRLIDGGADRERGVLRRGLTAVSAAFARRVLGAPVLDANSGFRAYRRSALEAIEPATLASPGPAIVHEVLHRAIRAGLRVREVPIEFAERRAGRSKLGLGRLVAGWLAVLRLGRA